MAILIVAWCAAAEAQNSFPGKGSVKDWNRACQVYDSGIEAFRGHHLDDSIRLYRKAIDIYPFESAFFCNLGHAYLVKGNLVQAERCVREALALKPEDIDYQLDVAVCLAEEKKYAEAQIALDKMPRSNLPAEMANKVFIFKRELYRATQVQKKAK